jgi:CDP-4-dehydro-6-deoxyglucose reductase
MSTHHLRGFHLAVDRRESFVSTQAETQMPFNVHVQPSGHQFEVGPGETVLAAALRHNVGLPYGCRDGKCGSCAAQLLAGAVDYPEGTPPAMEGAATGVCICCQAVPRSDLRLQAREVDRVAELEVRILPCRVVQIDHLAHDVVRLYLKLPEQQRLQFLAGQYLEFLLADGRARAFSIANAPHDDALIELHLRHVPGGRFTDHVFSQMKAKAILRIRAPLGTFVLREDSPRPMLFVAGGTGFAPIKGMIEHAFHVGIDRPLHLYWGVRGERDIYLPDQPRQWAAEHPGFRFTAVLSEPDEGWQGRRGLVHAALLEDYPDLSGFDVYVAGPPVMIEAARAGSTAAGLPLERLYSDAFEYAKDPGSA